MYKASFNRKQQSWCVVNEATGGSTTVGSESRANELARAMNAGDLLCDGCQGITETCVRCVKDRL